MKKTLKNILLSGGVLAGTLGLLGNAKAQTTGVTDAEIYNPFMRPSINQRYFQKNSLEYYGSGDVNNDNTVNYLDIQAIQAGTKNDMADVDGDGVRGTEADVQKLQGYLEGTDKLVGKDFWSDNVTNEERKKWILDLFRNVYMPSKNYKVDPYGRAYITYPGWVCDQYSDQAAIDFSGMTNPVAFSDEFNHTSQEYLTENNGRFNLFSLTFAGKKDDNEYHRMIAFPIGKDLTKFDNYLIIDGKTGSEARIDNEWIKENQIVDLRWHGVSEIYGACRDPSIIQFNVDANGNTSISQKNNKFLFQKPQEWLINFSNVPQNKSLNYNENLNLSADVQGKPTATSNDLSRVTLSIEDSERTPLNEEYPEIEYSFERKFRAESMFGTKDSIYQRFEVRDKEAPVITQGLEEETFSYDSTFNILDYVKNRVVATDNSNLETIVTSEMESSTQTNNKTASDVNYTYKTLITAKDLFGNETKKTVTTNIIDDIAPTGYLKSYSLTLSSGDNIIEKIKEQVENISDNSGLPVETIVSKTQDKYYDVTLKDVSGNENYLGNVYVDGGVGIDEIKDTDRKIDLEMPNPINPYGTNINIATKNPGSVKLDVIDMSGRLLEKRVFDTNYGDNSTYVEFNSLKPGVYLFKATDSKGNTDVEKIVVQNK